MEVRGWLRRGLWASTITHIANATSPSSSSEPLGQDVPSCHTHASCEPKLTSGGTMASNKYYADNHLQRTDMRQEQPIPAQLDTLGTWPVLASPRTTTDEKDHRVEQLAESQLVICRTIRSILATMPADASKKREALIEQWRWHHAAYHSIVSWLPLESAYHRDDEQLRPPSHSMQEVVAPGVSG
uniref:Uncharacterized protein n=1 Tax=Haptolina brevifila TaxID=156173 RepID=A0A7S2CA31_9EUKA